MKAIQTKYLPATNTKPSRVKAFAEGVKPLTISAGDDNAHAAAAIALAKRMGWTGTLVSGGLPDQSGEVFCFLQSDRFEIDSAV